ncbi:MAG: hypothetical protein HUJ25_01570, partial [Crocinitomicaceae bacterium]|nr:hypothetical protein [Crocinitomicaceae bacterium]
MKRPLIIAVAYLLFGILWIYFSDLLVFQFTDDGETIHRLQNYKGFAFVFLSTLLIFSLTYILYRQVFNHQKMLQQKVDNIQEQNLRILDNEERLLQAERVGKLGSWEYDPKEKKLIWSIITAEILEFTLEDVPTPC